MASDLIRRGRDSPPSEAAAPRCLESQKSLLPLPRPPLPPGRAAPPLHSRRSLSLSSVFFASAPSSSSSVGANLAVPSLLPAANGVGSYRSETERGSVGGRLPLELKRKLLRSVVTGGAGFVGSLIARVDSVIVVDNFFTGQKRTCCTILGIPTLISFAMMSWILRSWRWIRSITSPARHHQSTTSSTP